MEAQGGVYTPGFPPLVSVDVSFLGGLGGGVGGCSLVPLFLIETHIIPVSISLYIGLEKGASQDYCP